MENELRLNTSKVFREKEGEAQGRLSNGPSQTLACVRAVLNRLVSQWMLFVACASSFAFLPVQLKVSNS